MTGVGPPLHVVHVVRSDGFAGVERYVADTATELSRRGCRVDVVGGSRQRMHGVLPPGVRHHRGDSVAQVARALWRIGRVDVVHAHMTAAESAVAALRKRNRGAFVTTRHFAGRRGTSRLGRMSAPAISAQLDLQLAVSRFVADSIGEPSTVLLSGVPASETTRDAMGRVVTVLQRLEPEKSTDVAVRAWAASGLAEHGWRLEVHGAGSRLDALRVLAAKEGVADSTRFAGPTTTPRAVLARSAVLIAPTAVEALGLVVLEAMAEGAAVVAADGGAHRETLGPLGRYFPPGDAQACAEQLRRLAGDPEGCAQTGAALQERFLASFTVQAHVDRLLEHYRRVQQ
ncbi:glycosyltransferase family 4 protein [uncultured Jatrophihabitans sp.]|uniref:glycosyltransferase family 4 protein n=1 Tax=uncultured Jatrophihabitans sp. TaxID=1610747 RepID=UPI0035CBC68F